MADFELFEHNENALNSLNEALRTHDFAAVNHATGTGKSFIALKYLVQNNDKKYLYIAPTYPILDQLKKDATKLGINPDELNYDTMIYRTLLDLKMSDLVKKYDGFIFDEYHRCGARDTYLKIKELKGHIIRSEKNIKVVGLTATPIRYLDKERNMTDELFDGVIASSITLADAMCDELLPIPNYYISGATILNEYEKASKKINNLPNSQIKQKLLKEINSVVISENVTEDKNSKLFERYMHLDQGKYIIFCKDIETVELLSKNIKTWFKNIDLNNVFIVHSEMNDAKRKQNLSLFNDKKDGFNILLCVDVLNEGVHVDGVDGVILNRRTSSPIIYFQQIGRALSFSGRKKEIQIFDLVYNFSNHEAIYAVYNDFDEEIKQRIKQDPKNKAKYLNMLDKFKIIDESKDALEKIRGISERINANTIINAKVENAIIRIEKYVRDRHIVNEFSIDEIVDEDVIEAYYVIDTYYKYINNKQFEKLLKLKIELPPMLTMTPEERKVILGEFNSFYEKEKHQCELNTKDILEFIKHNNRTPKENSDDLIERSTFEIYRQCLIRLGNNKTEKLYEEISNLGIELEPWEVLLFNQKPSNEEVNKLLHQAVDILQKNDSLPKHIYRAIDELLYKYEFKDKDKVLKMLKLSNKIDAAKKKKERIEKYAIVEEILQSDSQENKNELIAKMDNIIQSLEFTYANALKRKYTEEKKMYIKNSLKLSNPQTISQFSESITRMDVDKIKQTIKMLEKDNIIFSNLALVRDFMVEHDDRLPSYDKEDEKRLCSIINKSIEDGLFTSQIMKIGFAKLKSDPNSHTYKIIEEIINGDGLITQVKLIIARQILFIKENDRKPILFSPNEKERKIATDYINIAVPNMAEHNQILLSRFMNKEKYLRNTGRKKEELLSNSEISE